MGLLDEIAGYVFDTRQQRESVCGFLRLDECVQMCVMYVPDLTGPRLWLWSDKPSGLVKKRLLPQYSPKSLVCLRFTVFFILYKKYKIPEL